MPAFGQEFLSRYVSEPVNLATSDDSPYDPPHRASTERPPQPETEVKARLLDGQYKDSSRERQSVEGIFLSRSDGVNSSLQSLPNGRMSESTDGQGTTHRRNDSKYSIVNGNGATGEGERRSMEFNHIPVKPTSLDQTLAMSQAGGDSTNLARPTSPEHRQVRKAKHKGHARAHSSSAPQSHDLHPTYLNNIEASPTTSQRSLAPHDASQASKNRLSAPLPNVNQTPSGSSTSLHPAAPRLHHRHTLEVPRISTSRTSRDFSYPGTASEGSESARFSPGPRTPRASNTLARAPTRSIHSDMYLDEVPADSDIAKWTETIRQKRASRRQRKEEEEDDRVVVGTKVDMNHVNWVTAYNMLTGIRFTVSRTNAKIDRELIDTDFDARHKFSFDM